MGMTILVVAVAVTFLLIGYEMGRTRKEDQKMTIRELYEWAKEKGIENVPVYISTIGEVNENIIFYDERLNIIELD